MNYLLRHSIDDNTRKGGWSNAKLTIEGIQLAHNIIKDIKQYHITKIICSDLERAKETCEIINKELQLPVVYSDLLREFNAGITSGMTYDQIEKEYPTSYEDYMNKDFKYPDGETLGNFQNRIIQYYNTYVKMTDNTLFITHRNVISVIYNYINNTEWNFLDKTTIKIPHCSMFEVNKNTIERIL